MITFYVTKIESKDNSKRNLSNLKNLKSELHQTKKFKLRVFTYKSL